MSRLAAKIHFSGEAGGYIPHDCNQDDHRPECGTLTADCSAVGIVCTAGETGAVMDGVNFSEEDGTADGLVAGGCMEILDTNAFIIVSLLVSYLDHYLRC